MKNKVDILSFTYSSKGRDIDIVEPVLQIGTRVRCYNKAMLVI